MAFSQEDQLKYKTLYLQTARQYTKDLLENLTKLEKGQETEDLIDTLHRDSHSLKGQSQMMGYQAIGTVALYMEKIFAAKKEKKLELSPEIISTMQEAVKEMDICLNEIDKVNKEIDMYQMIEKFKSLVKIEV